MLCVKNPKKYSHTFHFFSTLSNVENLGKEMTPLPHSSKEEENVCA
jgi:hypothetical protein